MQFHRYLQSLTHPRISMSRTKLPSAFTLGLFLITACGGGGGDGGGNGIDPDTQAPSVVILAPAAGQVQGTVQVTATATDDRGVVGVQFLLDGLALGQEKTSQPYTMQWISSTIGDGPHTLGAKARDAAGNMGTATTVPVTVANAPQPGPLRIVVSTTGVHPDADGYQVSLDGGTAIPVPANDSIDYASVAGGSHSLDLSGVATNCSQLGPDPLPVLVHGPSVTRVEIEVGCQQDLILYARGAFLVTMFEDGSGQTTISKPANFAADGPSWSPDGSQIVFSGGTTQFNIRVVPLGQPLDQSIAITAGIQDYRPAWAPDGSRIAYTKGGIRRDIYLVTPLGVDLGQVSDAATGSDEVGNWSPDGAQLVFESTRDGDGEIFVTQVDGSGVTQLTTDTTADFRPAFSPDGNQIVFVSARTGVGQSRLYLMQSDGNGVVQLTPDSLVVDNPAWSPDGQRIAFQGYGSDATTSIWRINADGSGLVRLTSDLNYNHDPSWRPR